MDKNPELLDHLTKVFREVFNENNLVLRLDMKNEDINNWTSLSHAVLIDSIEKEFKITFDIDEILTMQSVKDIYENIEKKISR